MANKFLSKLESISKVFVTIFKDAEKIAVVAEPFVDIAFPHLAPIYNAAANGAAAAVKAGQGAVVSTNTETKNVVAVAIAVEPVLAQFAKDSGLPAPTTATIIAYAEALAASLKKL
jgi:hypothetical protein